MRPRGPERALFGWSPPPLPADSRMKRRVDRMKPRTGVPVALFYIGVVALLFIAPLLPVRGALALDGLAALVGGAWCALNFWRCRHAHCAVTSVGWLALGLFAFVEAAIGRSLIGGDEQPVFLAVLALALVFEAAWSVWCGTNAIGPAPRR